MPGELFAPCPPQDYQNVYFIGILVFDVPLCHCCQYQIIQSYTLYNETKKDKVILEYAIQTVVELHSFKTLPCEWSSLYHDSLTARERYPSTHGIGGWVGSRVSVDVLETRKLLSLARSWATHQPACSLVSLTLSPYSLYKQKLCVIRKRIQCSQEETMVFTE